MAHLTKVSQYSVFVVFTSQYPISFIQVYLGMSTDNYSAIIGKESIGKPESYPTGAPCNNNDFHFFHYIIVSEARNDGEQGEETRG